jgi:hypothetical protein
VIGHANPSWAWERVRITDNLFYYSSTEAPYIDIEKGGSTNNDDVIISGNTFQARPAFIMTLEIGGVENFVIANNTFRDRVLVNINYQSDNGLVANNVFFNDGIDADVITNNGDRVTITGNHISSSQTNDLVVIGPSGESNTVGYNTYLSATGEFVAFGDAVSDSGYQTELQEVLTVGAIGETASIEREEAMLVTSGGVTITLPSAVAVGSGRVVYVKDRDGNASGDPITVDTQSAQTIDGLGTYLIDTDHESVSFLSDGSNWIIL